MSAGHPSPRRIKTHYSYTVAEAAGLLGVHRNTVRNWIGSGLETIRIGRLALILGDELRRFLTDRQAKRRVRCPPGTMFCLKCRDARQPPVGLIEAIQLTPTSVNLRGLCPVCSTLMYRRANLAGIAAAGFGDVATHAPTPEPS